MNRSISLLILSTFLSAGCFSNPTAAPAPPPKKVIVGGEFPISVERLTHAWLLGGIGGDPPHEWGFQKEEFFVDGSKTPLPKDISDALMGSGIAATRIEGKWAFDEPKAELVLTEIRGDGKKGVERATLPIAPAGMIRINLGKSQYNVRPLSKRP